MCRAVNCRTCGKTTWSGCGMHVNEVMSGVPNAKRCSGHAKAERTGGGVLSRMFGRG